MHHGDEGGTRSNAQTRPRVSIIIPAYNAATTIGETLDSLLGQSRPDWEAIVVNDGSTDDTQAVAERYARGEARIRVVQRPNGGEAAARNTGIARARAEWLLFLDADDWIKPAYLSRTLGVLESDASLGAVHCRWVRVAGDGTVLTQAYQPPAGDLFAQFARFPAFVVHACVVRRALVESVGGFDVTLKTSPDWDLWQRIARAGCRFGAVADELACYRMRPQSASLNARQLLTDSLRVIEQGHRPDPRVASPLPVHAQGLDREGLGFVKLDLLSWTAGLLLGKGEDPRPLLAQVPDAVEPNLDPQSTAQALFHSAPLARSQPPAAWATLWLTLEKPLEEFLLALEAHNHARGLAVRVRKVLEAMILREIQIKRPIVVGRTLGVWIEMTDPILDVCPPPGVERVDCVVAVEGAPIGTVELPVCEEIVPRDVLADAIAAECFWPILNRYFERTVYPNLDVTPGRAGLSIRRGELSLVEHLAPDEGAVWPRVFARAGWHLFLQELWGLPDWPLFQFDSQQMSQETGIPASAGSELMHVDVARPLPDISIGDDCRYLDIVPMVCGVPLGIVPVPVRENRVGPQAIRAAITGTCGVELCRLVVREAILGRRFDSPPGALRARLQEIGTHLRPSASLARMSRLGGASPAQAFRVFEVLRQALRSEVTIGRRVHGSIGSSVSRRANLPTRSLGALKSSASTSGERLVPPVGPFRPVRRVRYEPDLVGLATPKLNRTLGVDCSGDVLGCSNQTGAQAPETVMTAQLPILMYHRVAPSGLPALSQYRVTPQQFESHLQFLRDHGFWSITLDRWHEAMHSKVSVPGRAVLLTFDDGFLDFYDYAWPLLKRYGYSAMVFLVADYIGKTNEWDRAFGEAVPLMGWPQILELQEGGIQFGSHAASHRHLTALINEEVVCEGARSKAMLEGRLGRPVLTMAYPHGAEDRVVRHLIGACGYVYGLSTREGRCGFDEPFLSLPRVEIAGNFGIPELKHRLIV